MRPIHAYTDIVTTHIQLIGGDNTMTYTTTLADGTAVKIGANAVDMIDHINEIYETPGIVAGSEYRTAVKTSVRIMVAAGIISKADGRAVDQHIDYLYCRGSAVKMSALNKLSTIVQMDQLCNRREYSNPIYHQCYAMEDSRN